MNARGVAKLPGWDRLALPPQTFAPRARLLLDGRIARAVARRLLLLILLVVPCKPGFHLFETHIDGVPALRTRAFGGEHTAYDASVAIALVPAHEYPPAVCEIRQVLLRAFAVRLSALGRIDARQPDFVLLARFVEESESIAVGDRDDFAKKLRCVRGA